MSFRQSGKKGRSKYQVVCPDKDDCLWCSKTVAKPVRCIACKQAYHNRCADQCGYLPSGAVRKCCDALFIATSLPMNASYSEDSYCDSLASCSEVVTKQFFSEALQSLAGEITSKITLNTAALEAHIDARLLSIQSIITEVSAVASNNKAAIEELKTACGIHDVNIATLSTESDVCKNSVQTLQQEFNDFKTGAANIISDAVQVHFNIAMKNLQEDMYGEFLDRQRRSNNLIFFKLPELNTTKGAEADLNTIVNLLNLTINVDANSISVRRLGPFKNGKYRPLLVHLRSMEDVFAILSKKSTTYKDYSFTSDKTQVQRDYLLSLWSQVDEQNKNNPQVRKSVRFVNSVPRIVESSKNPKNV